MKIKNKMPELKAGMVIEVESGIKYLLIGEHSNYKKTRMVGLSLDGSSWSSEVEEFEVVKIWNFTGFHFKGIEKHLKFSEILWELEKPINIPDNFVMKVIDFDREYIVSYDKTLDRYVLRWSNCGEYFSSEYYKSVVARKIKSGYWIVQGGSE